MKSAQIIERSLVRCRTDSDHELVTLVSKLLVDELADNASWILVRFCEE